MGRRVCIQKLFVGSFVQDRFTDYGPQVHMTRDLYIPTANQVAAKVPKVVEDLYGELCAEEEKYAEAWRKLDNVLQPLGALVAHDDTGTPAVLLMEIAM